MASLMLPSLPVLPVRFLIAAVLAASFACGGARPTGIASPEGPIGPAPVATSAPSAGSPPQPARLRSAHTMLGAPTRIAAGKSDETLLDRGEFVVSYDESLHLARWVAWRVRKADLGKAKRKNQFHADPELPTGMLRIDTSDYVRSGYDRGHLCPSADRTATDEANHRTFLMTNMHAQRHGLNAGPWEELEVHTRQLLQRPDDVVYVVAGPLVDANPPRIGRGVAVPRASFKVLIALKEGAGAADVRETVYHAAAIMPNDEAADGKHWQTYETSIREVEQASGYDFFSEIPSAVQDAIETKRSIQ